jgi:hypothetical protein
VPYLFTPPQRKNVVQMERSLRYSFQVSQTVWKDASGVWRSQETPADDDLAAAQVVLGVTGRPSIVDDVTAAELTAAGIGTLDPLEGT